MSAAQQILEAGGLRLVFERQGDRWGHQVGLAAAGDWQPVFCSVEDEASSAWPLSPPLQEFHLEERNDRQLAMLVGMAGASHWSLAVELDRASGKAVFDVACRVRGQAERLGSAYRLLVPEMHLQLVTDPPHAWQPMKNAPQCLVLEVPLTNDSARTQTVRWRYTIALS